MVLNVEISEAPPKVKKNKIERMNINQKTKIMNECIQEKVGVIHTY